MFLLFFFFFQAEDGIRDLYVTGVQTCALPICQVFYTHQNGVPALRETLADYLSGLGARPIGPERITVTASGMNAIMLALQLVCEAGDNIIVVDPVWPNTAGMAGLLGVEVRSARMDHGQGGWTIDPARIAAAMDDRTRLVFFASPGNPTGAMVP